VLNNILIGCLMILLTSLVHALMTAMDLSYMAARTATTRMQRIVIIQVIVLMIIVATLLESLMWAGCYRVIGMFSSLDEAMYFSLVTFSTLGYGDIVPGPAHRILAGFEAANGIMIFGWSTALLVATLQKVFPQQKQV